MQLDTRSITIQSFHVDGVIKPFILKRWEITFITFLKSLVSDKNIGANRCLCALEEVKVIEIIIDINTLTVVRIVGAVH